MPSMQDDGIVCDVLGRMYRAMNPPNTRRSPGRPRKQQIESQFVSNKTIIFLDVIKLVIILLVVIILFSETKSSHFRLSCFKHCSLFCVIQPPPLQP